MTDLTPPTVGSPSRTAASGTALLAAAVFLVAGCASGGSERAAVRTAPVASLSDAVECAREQGEEIGFEVARINEDEDRLMLEREDEDVERSDPKFQRAVDQLRIEPAAGEPGSDRSLEVTARTYYEYFTRRGRTRRQREASPGVVGAAETLLERCASEAAAGS